MLRVKEWHVTHESHVGCCRRRGGHSKTVPVREEVGGVLKVLLERAPDSACWEWGTDRLTFHLSAWKGRVATTEVKQGWVEQVWGALGSVLCMLGFKCTCGNVEMLWDV